MIKVSVLGSAGGIPNAGRDSTYLSLDSKGFSALIDCAGSPVLKMQKVGIDPRDFDALIITHRHPDHTYGIPSLMQSLGLICRRKPLDIFGSQDVLELFNALIDQFELKELLEPLPLNLHEIQLTPDQVLFHQNHLTIWTTPSEHGVPTVSIKVQNGLTGRLLTYTSDTSPTDRLIEFARNSEILIHECSFSSAKESKGHSSGRQAGMVARLAQVKKLVLVHLPAFDFEIDESLREAEAEFSGEIDLPHSFQTYAL